MTNLREAAQQALAFTMRDFASLRDFEAAKAVLHDNLRAALAQQDEPVEPVAWRLTKTLDKRETTTNGYLWFSDPVNSSWTPLYTAPPQQAEPAQEPVAWVYASIAGSVALHIVKPVGVAKASFIQSKLDNDMHVAKEYPNAHSCTPLYTAPPQRLPLTEEEIDASTAQERDALLDHIYEYGTAAEGVLERIRKLCRAVERAHGIGEQP